MVTKDIAGNDRSWAAKAQGPRCRPSTADWDLCEHWLSAGTHGRFWGPRWHLPNQQLWATTPHQDLRPASCSQTCRHQALFFSIFHFFSLYFFFSVQQTMLQLSGMPTALLKHLPPNCNHLSSLSIFLPYNFLQKIFGQIAAICFQIWIETVFECLWLGRELLPCLS